MASRESYPPARYLLILDFAPHFGLALYNTTVDMRKNHGWNERRQCFNAGYMPRARLLGNAQRFTRGLDFSSHVMPR
jgi:hypothetical protein